MDMAEVLDTLAGVMVLAACAGLMYGALLSLRAHLAGDDIARQPKTERDIGYRIEGEPNHAPHRPKAS